MDKFGMVLVGMVLGVGLFGIVLSAMSEHTTFYKQGQIDAISGQKILFELKQQPDGTVTWERK